MSRFEGALSAWRQLARARAINAKAWIGSDVLTTDTAFSDLFKCCLRVLRAELSCPQSAEAHRKFTACRQWAKLHFVGLVLFAVLIFFGLRGLSIRQAAPYCLVTAVILALLSVGAMDDQAACQGLGCDPSLPGLALAFFMALAMALLSFGGGVAMRRFVNRIRA